VRWWICICRLFFLFNYEAWLGEGVEVGWGSGELDRGLVQVVERWDVGQRRVDVFLGGG
jgi:hypothetical protein